MNESDYKIHERIYLTGLFLWIFQEILSRSEYLNILSHGTLSILRFSGLALIIFQGVLLSKYNIRRALLGILIVWFTVWIGYNASEMYLLDFSIVIYFAKDIPFKKLIKAIVVMQIGIMLFILGSWFIHILPSVVTYREGSARYNLGYSWTTYSAQMFFYITCMYIGIKGENFTIFHTVTFFIPTCLLYKLTDTKSPFYIGVLLLVLITAMNMSNKKIKGNLALRVSVLSILPIFSYLIYFATTNYLKYPSLRELNVILTGRLRLGYTAILQYGVHPFSQVVHFEHSRNLIGVNFLFVDSSYVQLILKYGYVWFFLLLILVEILLARLMKIGDKYMIIGMIFIIIHATFDPQFYELFYNGYLILIGGLLLPYEKWKQINSDNNESLSNTL